MVALALNLEKKSRSVSDTFTPLISNMISIMVQLFRFDDIEGLTKCVGHAFGFEDAYVQ